MDSNANTNPVNPDPKKPHDIAEAGPIDPATGQPDHGAEVSALKAWFRANAVSLIITAIIVALVCIYLDPIDTLKVVIGLGLVIFIHELGHFLAAKWCDVHVKTFSIGFGPAVPFCSYKWGETTYMVGIIPLGGYVAMVGEGEGGEGEEEGEEDPRSFRKKTVGQRMLIISAGVIMNIILGMACFVAVYLHGVQEKPATVGWVESGGAAWQAGLRTDDEITNIDGRDKPFFDDVRPIVMSTQQDEQVPIRWKHGNEEKSGVVMPIRDEGQRFPQLGIAPPYQLTLANSNKHKDFKPVIPGTKAAEAKDPAFGPGDRIVGMSDPNDPAKVTPLEKDDRGQPKFTDYHKRLVLLAGKPVTFAVLRKGQSEGDEPTLITVQPAFRYDLGMRMRMGEIVALRKGGPAAAADVHPRSEGPPPVRGDRIVEVKVTAADGKEIKYAAGDKANPLDPLLLPQQLAQWSATNPPNRTVTLVLLRESTDKHTDEPITRTLEYDPSFRFDRETLTLPNSPVPISGLGLAYWVEAVIDEVAPDGPAANAKTVPGQLPGGFQHRVARFFALEDRNVAPGGDPMPLRPNDIIVAVRFNARDEAGNVAFGDWEEIKSNQWAFAEAAFQTRPPFEIDLRVKRGEEVIEVTLKGREDMTRPVDERGLLFQYDFRVQKATDVGEAIELGARRTVRFIKIVYMNLYSMIFGRVSAKTMSGPLTIATVSYRFAGEDFWQFLLFLGMISVNLAVVNFLPIPVLDGGHMVFLILEKILGRPVPERLFAFAMYTGLFLILSLMIFVIVLDVRRLFFGWF
ncbi:MAG: site-2 protease family protein [Planctomycetia bacterium]|nr:site-2 protease family protein [Planctomycetia bacterium]